MTAIETTCPVRPLGHCNGRFFFFDAAGQLVERNAGSIGHRDAIVALFGGDGVQWAIDRFPLLNQEGQPTNWFSSREVARHLIDRCFIAGLFSADLPERGYGVWSAEGVVAVHLGDVVLWPGTDGRPDVRQAAGFKGRGALWPALPPLPPPAPAADAATAQLVERALQKWRWSQPEEWRVLTGLWAAGLLGAAIRWRPHGLVVGQPGSGKSTLMEFYAALSPLSLEYNDPTEAGLRQYLSGRAAPLILDESEEDGTKLQKVVVLLRKASGGKGAQSVRGSSGGRAQQFTFTSPAMMGAVLPPALLPQDATRITRVDVLPIPDHAPTLPVADLMAWATAHAPALWGRALAGIQRFNTNLTVVRSVLADRGCSPRLADQIGTIIAARAMMLEDEPLDAYAAAQDVEALSWLAIAARHQTDDAGPMSCLMHLLSSAADLHSGGERPSIGTLIHRARQVDGQDARRQLVEHGLMVDAYPRRTPTQFLYVANKHARLGRLFDDTQWQLGRWKEDLRHLPGAIEPPDPQWFCGKFKSRCVLIPESLLPGADREITHPAPPAEQEDAGAR